MLGLQTVASSLENYFKLGASSWLFWQWTVTACCCWHREGTSEDGEKLGFGGAYIDEADDLRRDFEVKYQGNEARFFGFWWAWAYVYHMYMSGHCKTMALCAGLAMAAHST